MTSMAKIVLSLLLLTALPAALPTAARADIILNEILCNPEQDWDGDGTPSFKGDEWIEVLNTGPGPEDLTRYYLRDIYGSDPHLQLTGVLEPGAVAVFYGSEAMAWQTAHGFSDYGFALNNTGETVELLHELGEDGAFEFELVDAVTMLPHETDTDRSSGWAADGSGWVLYDAWNEYGGSLQPGTSGCQPTPGELNVCVPLVPVERKSWGVIKTFYR